MATKIGINGFGRMRRLAMRAGWLQETLGFVRINEIAGDAHSCIVDALSTREINDTQVKIYAWYDNEWGYANRLIDLTRKVAAMLPT